MTFLGQLPAAKARTFSSLQARVAPLAEETKEEKAQKISTVELEFKIELALARQTANRGATEQERNKLWNKNKTAREWLGYTLARLNEAYRKQAGVDYKRFLHLKHCQQMRLVHATLGPLALD